MVKILIIGATGLVGSRFVELFKNKYKLLSPFRAELDILNKDLVKKYIQGSSPEVIVNFAAYTNVSEAENQRGNKNEDCWKVNVEGVRNILEAIGLTKTHFIQVSTDYVFSGKTDDPGPYDENHIAETDSDKLTWYGHSKAEAERLILKKLGDDATILRIIYPVRETYKRKLDYLKKALDKYNNGRLPPLFTDQTLSITFVDEASRALSIIIDRKLRGIFHASSRDTTTPAKLIPMYLEKVLGEKPRVTTSQMGEWANRFPQHGGLKVADTEKKLGLRFSTTEEIGTKVT